jgi:hypothetical protein
MIIKHNQNNFWLFARNNNLLSGIEMLDFTCRVKMYRDQNFENHQDHLDYD